MKRLVIVAAIVLSGCSAGPKNVAELKNTDYKDSFFVNKNYQETYRNFKNSFSQCGGFESTWLKPSSVDTELYSDIGEGRITINLVPGVGQQKPMTYIQIKRETDTRSEVIIYYRQKSSIEKSGALYRRWANGDTACE